MKKTELQERVRAAHGQLTKALDGLSDEQATRVGVTPEWSVKDSLAHIAAWEIEGARILAEIQSGTWKPQRLDKQTIEDFNVRAVEERRARSMNEVRQEFDAAHARMEEAIASLPDEVDEKSPAYKFVEGVTFRHHTHHAAQIIKFSNE
jgi:uncharacterized damage-inducible protein DinB